jgi:hypothetical protein
VRIPARTVLAFALMLGPLGACDDEIVAEPAPSPRRASEYRSERLVPVLEAADEHVRTRGFAPEGDEWRGFLVDQGSAVDEVALEAGACYVWIGAASTALVELSLRTYDSDGAEVAQDAHPGATAALHFCPAHAGTYYVGALATRGTGLFAVRRYAGPTGLDLQLDDLFGGVPPTEGSGPERP